MNLFRRKQAGTAAIAKARLVAVLADDHGRGTRAMTARDFASTALRHFTVRTFAMHEPCGPIPRFTFDGSGLPPPAGDLIKFAPRFGRSGDL